MREDDALGAGAKITRRDFLDSALLASGGVLMSGARPLDLLKREDWTGYGGSGDYAGANGNTYEVMSAGHAIRNREFADPFAGAIATGETFDCVMVGGGISGLAAALFFTRQAGAGCACLVLDDHPIFGGEAKRNEFRVGGERLIAHQGSALAFPPLPGTFLDEFYDSIGIDFRQFEYQTWGGAEAPLAVGREPYFSGGPASGFYFGKRFQQTPGMWLRDPWGNRLEGAPFPPQVKRELLARQGPPQVERKVAAHGDATARYLDGITIEEDLVEQYGISRTTIRGYLLYHEGDGAGLGPDALSAYLNYAPDVLFPHRGTQMFPGGNTGVARHLVKALIPASLPGPATLADICRAPVRWPALDQAGNPVRLRLNATVLGVRHVGKPEASEAVEIAYLVGAKRFRLRARSVVMANGSWTTRRIVADLPGALRDAYAQFYRAPCLMANVAVRNWRFLYKLGMTDCQWFEGFGRGTTLRRIAIFGTDPATLSPDRPAVLNLKVIFPAPGLPLAAQVTQGRAELLSTPYRAYERRIREQFTEMFARAGFDAKRDIAGIILNRWGHAYLAPQPGFFFGRNGQPGPGDVLRARPFGRVAFANSDLSGIMDHRASITEARRAVSQLSS